MLCLKCLCGNLQQKQRNFLVTLTILIATNEGWGDPTFWYAMGQMVNKQTPIYYYNAIDMTYDQDQNVIRQEENRRVYVQTWIKTLKVSIYVTFFCLILDMGIFQLLSETLELG